MARLIVSAVLLMTALVVRDDDPVARWILLSPAGSAPPGRIAHTAVYDEANDRMIVFGGQGVNSREFNDTWVLQHASGSGGTPSWTQLATAGGPPPVRTEHSAVYDAANNRMIVFDGYFVAEGAAVATMVNDIWVLSNANGLGGTPTWTRLSPSGGPAARSGHSAVYDAAGNRMIIFGGNVKVSYCFDNANDVWVLSNANGLGGTPAWSQLSPSNGPPGIRTHASAVYDPGSNRMTLVWGKVECTDATIPDVWTLTHANGTGGTPVWNQVTTTGAAPPREKFGAAYDSASHRAIIFGGAIHFDLRRVWVSRSDVWFLSDATGESSASGWTQILRAGWGPGARLSSTVVYNGRLNRMIVFGGISDRLLNEVWVLTRANGQ